MQPFVPGNGNPLTEGLRLAGWNACYIAASAVLFTAVSFVALLLSGRLSAAFAGVAASVALLGIIAAGYVYLWVRYSARFARRPDRPGLWRTLLVNLIGILPNPACFFAVNAWFAQDDSCGAPLVAILAYLSFWLPVFIMPLAGLCGWAVARASRSV